MRVHHTRRQTEAPVRQAADPIRQGPPMDALRVGLAAPAPEQLGSRVDLPGAIRAKMESAFGADLSAVQLYESPAVADAGAEAITQGNKIGFAPGKLDFVSHQGQALLGHELSHVVSQARGEVSGSGFLNDHALEARADREGTMAAAGEPICSGPVTGSLSPVSAAPAAGPMQARKAKSKKALLKDDFDPLSTASANVPDNPDSFLYESIFATKEDRQTMGTTPGQILRGVRGPRTGADGQPTGPASMESSFGSQEEGEVKGNVYYPAEDKKNQKHVIVYSGSGGSNQDQMGGQIQKYLEEGYTVHAYDYGGYGQSTTPDGKVSERSMERDAQRIFDHVLNHGSDDGPLKAKDILLHGFSMGGAMASHVARNQAIKAAKATGPDADDEKLGGLLLESSMRTTQNAANSILPVLGGLGGAIGGKLYGQFDTLANLEEISKLDADMPVTFISGTAENGDHLAESKTRLFKDSQKRFHRAQSAQAESDHLSQDKLLKTWDRIKNGLMR